MSVYTYVLLVLLSRGRISIKLNIGDFHEKSIQKIQVLVKIGQKYRALYMKTYCIVLL